MRCPACSIRQRRAKGRDRDRARYPRRRAQVLAAWQKRMQDPRYREYRRRYMRAYRAANERDGFDRAYQRAYMAARRSDPAYRALQNARKRDLRARRREARAMAGAA
ncbi:MAG: hypothetical protein ACHQWU_15515 [Gemmatimonadales bacterium]